MGLFKKLGGISRRLSSSNMQTDENAGDENPPRNKSVISLVPLSEVTEASLAVWRQLPGTIRHDPSMISFQQEHDRWKGEYQQQCGGAQAISKPIFNLFYDPYWGMRAEVMSLVNKRFLKAFKSFSIQK